VALRSTSLLVFVLALAALAPGCGSGSDEKRSSTTSSTERSSAIPTSPATVPTIPTSSIDKAEFVKQANAICKLGRVRLAGEVMAFQEKHLNELSEKAVPGAARAVIKPALEAQINQMRSLGAPQGDADEIEKFFAALLGGADEIISKKPLTFSQAEGMLQPAGNSARRYGITQCSYVLADPKPSTTALNSG
jgi:hypothetical protein